MKTRILKVKRKAHKTTKRLVSKKYRTNPKFELGQYVRIKNGAFANFDGEIVELNDNKFWVLSNLFGGRILISCNIDEIEPFD